VKEERPDLIPVGQLRALASHYGKGAEKYTERDEQGNVVHDGANNWRLGYEWSKSYAALQRHAMAFWEGEDVDEETGSLHLIAAAWHALTLAEFLSDPKYGRFDDRPNTESIVEEDVHEDHVHVEPDPVATSPEPDSGYQTVFEHLEDIPTGLEVVDKYNWPHRFSLEAFTWQCSHPLNAGQWMYLPKHDETYSRKVYDDMYGPFTVVAKSQVPPEVPPPVEHRGYMVSGRVQTLGEADCNFSWRDRHGAIYTYESSPAWCWHRSDEVAVPDFLARLKGDFDALNGPYTRVDARASDR